jgi:hypothetical protein
MQQASYTQVIKKTIRRPVMPNIVTNNLMFFLPMAFAGLVLFGEVPVASKLLRTVLRAVGAVGGALMALLVLEVLPALI